MISTNVRVRIFEPYPRQAQPRQPFAADDAHKVRLARLSPPSPFLHGDEPKASSLTQCVLRGGPADAGAISNRTDMQGADATRTDFVANNTQRGELPGGEMR